MITKVITASRSELLYAMCREQFTRMTQKPPAWHRGICPQVWWDSTLLSEPCRTAQDSTWQTEKKENKCNISILPLDYQVTV